jgi:solute carrier family 25 aspartate/glutamate transporter 12/13
MRRATMEELDEVFLKYASLGEDGEQRFMTPSDFLVRYLGLPIACEETVALLASAIDTTGDGRISRGEFYAFETTLNLPDSLFRVAYQLFDQDGSGSISLENVKDLMSRVVLRYCISACLS